MDAFNLLKADHQKVAGLFDQLEAARGAKKLSVFTQIKTELELHTYIEEKIFYPALEEPEETHDLTLEAYEEHDVVKNLLKQLGRARTVTDEWEAQAKVLRENVEHHVEEEENELFQKASEALEQEEIEDLGARMEAEKMRKQKGRGATASKSSKSAAAKKSAKKATKKSGSKKSASVSKTSRSAAAKTTKRSGSKKSAKKR